MADEPGSIPMGERVSIREEWEAFSRALFPAGAADTQIIEMRRAFYGGVASMMGMMSGSLDPGPEQTANDTEWLRSIDQELKVYGDQIGTVDERIAAGVAPLESVVPQPAVALTPPVAGERRIVQIPCDAREAMLLVNFASIGCALVQTMLATSRKQPTLADFCRQRGSDLSSSVVIGVQQGRLDLRVWNRFTTRLAPLLGAAFPEIPVKWASKFDQYDTPLEG